MGYLYEIQTEVQHFAEVISEALSVETEIIDENMAVVGSTSYNALDYEARLSYGVEQFQRPDFQAFV